MKKFGLSFKGGAARGLAAIGIIRFFQEENLTPTVLAGSSSGALLSAGYSLGYKWSDLLKIIKEFNINHLFSLRSLLFQGSLISYHNYRNMLLKIHTDMDIKELPIKTIIMATDSKTCKRYYLEKGNLIDALIASSGFLPFFPVIKLHHRILVDGSLSPSYDPERLKKYGADIVIGAGNVMDNAHGSDYISKFVNIFSILSTQIETYNHYAHPIDYEISYSVNDYGLLNFNKVEEMAEHVYRITCKKRNEIFKLLEVN